VVRLGIKWAARAYPLMALSAALLLIVAVATGYLPTEALLALVGTPLLMRATMVAAQHHDSPMELAPANAYTVVGHLACTLALAIGLVWARVGALHPGLIATAVAGLLVLLYYNRSIGRLARAFHGVRDAVA